MTIPADRFWTHSLRELSRGDDVCQILATAINSADAGAAVHNHVSLDGNQLWINQDHFDLDQYKRVFVIGAGKAVVPMAGALSQILGNRITTGLIITKTGYLGPATNLHYTRISIIEASHPIPDQSNLEASFLLVPLLHDLHNDDLVITLISGGGSALLMRLPPHISLADIQKTTQLLLVCGADISEINTVRKHLDEFKGGKLARLVHPATVISLILSDVVGDYLEQIASGPTVADPSTYQDAWSIFEKYGITHQIPPSIHTHIQEGMIGKLPETLKPGDPIFNRVTDIIIGNNSQTVMAAGQAATRKRFHTQILTSSLQGEASQAGHTLIENAKSFLASSAGVTRPACFVAGGETTVTIHGTGKGGRNQELALGVVKDLAGDEAITLVSLATDGGDGPTDAAGAVVTNQTFQRSLSMGLDPDQYLANNDAYHYFEHLGDLIKTGPTLTNVNDLVFIFAL